MCELCKRYGINEEQVKNLVKDGWFQPTAPFHDEVYIAWKNISQETDRPEDAVLRTAAKFNIDRSTVYRIIAKFS